MASDEPILDPERRIVDPHHHLWPAGTRPAYLLDDLHADTGAGHRVEQTVFIECLAAYRTDGPEHLKSVGEVEFVRGICEASKTGGGARVAAIVASAFLADPYLEETLHAQVEAGGGYVRGVRHGGAFDRHAPRPSHHHPPEHLYASPAFHKGLAVLASHALSFDAWCYHPQIPELTSAARAVPEARIVLDHFGGPVGFAPYTDGQERFRAWLRDVTDLATCPNVFMKLGGMAMPVNGYGWENRAEPPSSEDFVRAQGDYYRAAIDLFGPSRCMFESNFPVDKVSLPYATLWNAFKRLAGPFSETERDALFYGTAARFYRLEG